MTKFSQEFLEKLKDSINMEELAGRYTELNFNGKVLIGRCPHKDHNDSTPSFRVVPETNSWFCGGCHSGKKDVKAKRGKNYGSDCIAFMQWMFRLSFYDAVIKLCEMYGIEPEKDENSELYDQQRRRALSYHANLNEKMTAYLHDRGLTDETISEYKIGYNGKALTIPLLNRQRSYVGFTNRYFTEDMPKYKNSYNSDIFHKSSYLFGIHQIDREFSEIRITEGAFDQILPKQFGVRNVVATLGTSFTEQHAELIKNLGLTPVFIMDGDEAGQKALEKAAEMMAKHNVYCKVLVLKDKMDLADLANMYQDMTEEYIQDHAITYGQYVIQDVLKEYEAKVTELNLKIMPSLKHAMGLIKDTSERKVIADRIYRNTGLRL